MLITLDHVSALLSVISAVIDMHSASITKQSEVKYKVLPFFVPEFVIFHAILCRSDKISGKFVR